MMAETDVCGKADKYHEQGLPRSMIECVFERLIRI